jgi:hypothetical protein
MAIAFMTDFHHNRDVTLIFNQLISSTGFVSIRKSVGQAVSDYCFAMAGDLHHVLRVFASTSFEHSTEAVVA